MDYYFSFFRNEEKKIELSMKVLVIIKNVLVKTNGHILV